MIVLSSLTDLFGILVIDLFVRNNKEASMDAIHVIH